MRRETKSQGSGRRKPLRRWETLRADGTGEVNRYIAIAQAEKRRKDEEPQGRCHQLSGCMSCTRPVHRCLHQGADHDSSTPRCRRDQGGRQAFGPPSRITWCFGINGESARRPKDSQSQDRFGGSQRLRNAFGFGPRAEGEWSRRKTSLTIDFGRLPNESFGSSRSRKGNTTTSSRPFDRASARSIRHAESASADSATSA